ncbi:MAG: hypothetical protein MMC23_002646 [Stictis urceolatum]|nr:hypothetical protein [Stictis urceolata]
MALRPRAGASRGRPPLRLAARPQRNRRDLSTSHTQNDSETESDAESPAHRPTTRSSSTKQSTSSKPRTVSTSHKPRVDGNQKNKTSAKKKRKAYTPKFGGIRPKKQKTAYLGTPKSKETQQKSAVKAPSWPRNLPYEILLQIFQYSAYPLCNEQYYGNKSVPWLLQTARICKDFMEPALAALYYSPPLLPASRAHGLFSHLQSQSDSSAINYKVKIKYLEIEAANVLTLKHAGQDPVDLKKLVSLCPQLRGVNINLHADVPGTYDFARRLAPVYQDALFQELDAARITLRQFKWNYLVMTAASTPWTMLAGIHGRPSFASIRDLEIAHLGEPNKLSKSRWQSLVKEVAQSFGSLENLKKLKFTKCRLDAYEALLENTSRLAALKFVDCDGLRSDYLGRLLKSRGSHLLELVLYHNRDLDLSFSQTLATDCPSLKLFLMDFQRFSGLLPFASSEPAFDVVLPTHVTPTWPRSLQHLELVYIRKWDLATALDFFKSLWESASNLPDLRTLIIKSIVDHDWRDRIQFRNLWVQRLESAYLRKASTPVRHGKSITGNGVTPDKQHSSTGSRIDDTAVESRVKSLRKATKGFTAQEGDNEATVASHYKFLSQAVQPLCEVVDIRIESIRPMQTMFKEEDFVDSEVSGDEDWDGDDANAETGYAW